MDKSLTRKSGANQPLKILEDFGTINLAS